MTDAIWKWALHAAEKGQLPDELIRWVRPGDCAVHACGKKRNGKRRVTS